MNNRLSKAMSKMTACAGATGWLLPIVDTYDGEGDEQFFFQVEMVKKLLNLPFENRKTDRLESMTGLRCILESALLGYTGKAHLAVALVEMGHPVVFEDMYYFKSDFNAKPFIRLRGP